VAAWSSSGVVRVHEDFWGMDEHTYIQLQKSGNKCAE